MIFVDGYPIDAALSEDHTLANDVTSDPVEGGSDTTDNVRILPDEVSYECVVSDHPMGEIASLRAVDGLFSTAKPSVDAHRRMRELRKSRKPVTVIDSLGAHENMMVVVVGILRKAEGGQSLRFTLKFKQIEIVTNERTIVKVAVPRAAKKESRGNKAATPGKPDVKADRNSSILWKAIH